MSKIIELPRRLKRAPGTENGKVPSRRRRNAESRPREFLKPDEVEQLMKAAKDLGRHGQRDQTLILLAYRRGWD